MAEPRSLAASISGFGSVVFSSSYRCGFKFLDDFSLSRFFSVFAKRRY